MPGISRHGKAISNIALVFYRFVSGENCIEQIRYLFLLSSLWKDIQLISDFYGNIASPEVFYSAQFGCAQRKIWFSLDIGKQNPTGPPGYSVEISDGSEMKVSVIPGPHLGHRRWLITS